jgi:hypothetical protein
MLKLREAMLAAQTSELPVVLSCRDYPHQKQHRKLSLLSGMDCLDVSFRFELPLRLRLRVLAHSLAGVLIISP